MQHRYVALDLEMTGLDPERDEIIELAAVRFVDGEETESHHSLVRPDVDLPLRIQQLTGIDPASLRDAPSAAEALPALGAFVGGDPLVGQSVGKDLRFLRRQGLELPGLALDTYVLGTVLVPEAPRFGLDDLLEALEIRTPDAHRALADARAHGLLFEALLERARRLEPSVLGAIRRMAARVDWPEGALFDLAADRPLALSAAPRVAPPPRPDPLRPAEDPRPLDEDALAALIGPDGPLARRVDGYEDRPSQRAMLRRVGEAFRLGDHLLVEAGTGTGKSLAYLLPAAAWAQGQGRPALVATHTIPLQDQLVGKDLPLVRELLGGELRFAVLKGRANYLCRSRLAALLQREDLDRDSVWAAAKLLVWSRATRRGDRAELFLRPEDERAWRLVNADGGACTPERCGHAARGDCFLQRARAQAEAAHVLVVSHALLVTDLLTENRLLPRARHLVIDEAHHLEDVATATLGFRCGAAQLRDLVAPLAAGGKSGLPARCAALLQAGGLPTDTDERMREALDALRAAARASAPGVETLFSELDRFLPNGRGRETRLTEAVRSQPEWMAVEQAWDALGAALEETRERAALLARGLVAAEGQLGREAPALIAELQAAQRELLALADGLERVIAAPEREDVTWAARTHRGAPWLHRAPLDVGERLARELFGDKETLVLTSATLRAPDFDYLRDRLDLPDADAAVIDSPFDYARQALLCLPTDMPLPGAPGYQAALDRCLLALAQATKGRMLVLYTSHSGLRESYHALRRPLGERGIALIGQGLDGSRHRLLEALRDPDGPTVLLGTRSFWEGVDLPGPALSCVAIARLPFDVPSDPVFAARSERFDEPFLDYSVPRAVLRFRQGVGRLVRTRADRGVVVALDGRLTGRRYGERFLDALPAMSRRELPLESIPLFAREFLETPPARESFPAGAGDDRMTAHGGDFDA